MASPSYAVSQTWAFNNQATAVALTANFWYATIVVENGTGVPLSVCTDGGTAVVSPSTHEDEVPPPWFGVFDNLQPLPNASNPGSAGTAKYYNGFVNSGTPTPNGGPGAFDQSAAVGWSAQRGFAATNFTSCSVIPQSGTNSGNVTISFQ